MQTMTPQTTTSSLEHVVEPNRSWAGVRTVAQREAVGRALRTTTPRSSHAAWTPPINRADPIDLLEAQAKTRLPELVPIRDGRKTWKLSPMDLEAHRCWYDYSRARDAMFAATDTLEAPWYVIDADDQKRARLNCIAHLLSQIPYEEIPGKPVKLPKRQDPEGYIEPNWRRHPVPEMY